MLSLLLNLDVLMMLMMLVLEDSAQHDEVTSCWFRCNFTKLAMSFAQHYREKLLLVYVLVAECYYIVVSPIGCFHLFFIVVCICDV